MNEFDVAIVGAGPAGSATAITLAQRGYQVALLDRAVFPRDKMCGDSLNPGAILSDFLNRRSMIFRPANV